MSEPSTPSPLRPTIPGWAASGAAEEDRQTWRYEAWGLTLTSSVEGSKKSASYRLSAFHDHRPLTDDDKQNLRRSFEWPADGGVESTTEYSAPIVEWSNPDTLEVWDLTLPCREFQRLRAIAWLNETPHRAAIDAALQTIAQREARAIDPYHATPHIDVVAVTTGEPDVAVCFIVDVLMYHSAQSGSDWAYHHIMWCEATFQGDQLVSDSAVARDPIYISESDYFEGDGYDRAEMVRRVRDAGPV